MARNITVTFDDGSTHVYQNAPDDVTPDAVSERAQKEFGKAVKALDGGRNAGVAPQQVAPPESSLLSKIVDYGVHNLKDNAQQFSDASKAFAHQSMKPFYGAVEKMYQYAAPVTDIAARGVNAVTGGINSLAGTNIPQLPEDAGTAQAKRYSEAVGQNEQEYQREVPNSPGAYIGAVSGALNPYNPANYAIGRATAVKQGAKILPRMISGAEAGALYGGLQPVGNNDNYWKDSTLNTLLGGVIGGAVPVVTSGVEKVGATLKDLYDTVLASAGNESSATALFKKALQRAAGGQSSDIVNAIDTAQGPSGAAVSQTGNTPTTGQLLASANRGDKVVGSRVAKLESELAKAQGADDILNTKYAGQAANRQAAIEKFAGDPSAEIAARKSATDPLYGAVQNSTAKVDVSPVVNEIDQILGKNKNRDIVVNALVPIRARLEVNGAAEENPQNLVSLRDNIKDLISKKNPDGSQQYDVASLTRVKSLLEKQIGAAEPKFTEALQKFKELSGPVNQKEIGNTLLTRLVSPMEKETPGAFTRAVEPGEGARRTIRGATGFNRGGSLADYLTPENNSLAEAVNQELLTNAKLKDLVSMNSGAGLGKNAPEVPNLLSRPMTLANYIGGLAGQNAEPAIVKAGNKIMLDPKVVQQILSLPKGNPTREMLEPYITRGASEAAVNVKQRYLSGR